EIAAKIKAVGGDAVWVSADLITPEGAQKAVAKAEDAYGRLDILFNNMGDSAGRGLRVHETPEDDWAYLMNVNINAQYLTSKYAIPALIRARGGLIIHMTASYDVRLRAPTGSAA